MNFATALAEASLIISVENRKKFDWISWNFSCSLEIFLTESGFCSL